MNYYQVSKLRYLLIIPLLFISMLASLEGEAQNRNKYKKQRKQSKAISSYKGGNVGSRFRPYAFAGANLNALNYYGDLAPVNKAASTDVTFTRPGFGGIMGYKFHPNIAVRGGLNWGRIKGDDFTSDPFSEQGLPRYARNVSFRNDIKELHVGFEFYFLPNNGGPNTRPNLNAYLFVGGAAFHHEPRGKVPEYDYQTYGPNPPPGTPKLANAGEWVKLRPLGTEGQFIDGFDVEVYRPIQFSIPIALGVTMRLPGPFDVGMEFGYRYLFTDYIDDVSNTYVDLDLFDDPIARIMSDRGVEPIAVWNGEERILTGTPMQTFYNANDSTGTTYYISGYVGGGTTGAIRGNPKDRDMIFMTSIKVTMVLGRVRRTAKFR